MDNFRAASPGRQLMLFGVGFVLIASVLVGAYFLFFRTSYSVLFSNLRPMDAATIVSELDKRKTPYELQADGTTIMVPAKVVDTTRLAVMSEDLPIKGTVGFELFNKSDMGLTDFAQKINYQRALQGELARTIMTMDSIDTVRVHLALSEPTIFRDERSPPKASVTVITRKGIALASDTVRGIQRLVAAAVPDLDTANVVVLDEHGRSMGAAEASSDGIVSPIVQERRAIEQYWIARIRQLLADAMPSKTFEVSVWAGINRNHENASAAGADDSRSLPPQPGATRVVALADGPGGKDRDYRLRITLATANGLTLTEQADLNAVVGGALRLDPALGDELSFSTAIPASEDAPEAAAPAAVRPAIQTPQPVETEGRSASYWPWITLTAAMLLGVALIARQRSTKPRKLSERQRQTYSERLQKLLDEEDGHVTPRA